MINFISSFALLNKSNREEGNLEFAWNIIKIEYPFDLNTYNRCLLDNTHYKTNEPLFRKIYS